jgi:hypothetical protein
MTTPVDIANAQANELLRRIEAARRAAVRYRTLNVALFLATKFGVPALSAVVTANLFLSTIQKAFLSDATTMILAIGIIVLSASDTICNPAEKKRMAFKTANRLSHLDQNVRLSLASAPDTAGSLAIIQSATTDLKNLLDEYADRGW